MDEEQLRVLRLGPKFCTEPTLQTPERLALAQGISRNVSEEEKEFCLKDCVDVVASAKRRCRKQADIGSLARYLHSKDLSREIRQRLSGRDAG